MFGFPDFPFYSVSFVTELSTVEQWNLSIWWISNFLFLQLLKNLLIFVKINTDFRLGRNRIVYTNLFYIVQFITMSSHYSIELSTISGWETSFIANTPKYRNSILKLLCWHFPSPFIYDDIYRSSFVRICSYTRVSSILRILQTRWNTFTAFVFVLTL